MIGLYTARQSFVHALPAGLKLAGLFVLALILAFSPYALSFAASAAVVLGLWALARLPFRALAGDVRPLFWLLLAICLIHALFGQIEQGGIVAGRLLILVAAAMLVTRTTPMTHMLSVMERLAAPVRVMGWRPERIAFLVVLTIRLVPVIVTIVSDVRDAMRARGARRAWKAMVLSASSQTVLFAGHLGDALEARGPRTDIR